MNIPSFHRLSVQLLHVALVILLLGTAHTRSVPAALVQGDGAKSHACHVLSGMNLDELVATARQGVQTHHEVVAAHTPAIILDPPTDPSLPHTVSTPYTTPGVDPLTRRLIHLQKTSAEL